jgi:hypothetical protein
VATKSELTKRIDEESEAVARLVAKEAELRPQLAKMRKRAGRLEKKLENARAKGVSFKNVAFETAWMGIDWWWLPLAVGPIAIGLIGLASECGSRTATEPYRFVAVSSVIASPDRALVGEACEVTVSEVRAGECHALVRCAGRTVFDGVVACVEEEHVVDTGDGETSTSLDLAATADGFALAELGGALTLGDKSSPTRITMHRWSIEGSL